MPLKFTALSLKKGLVLAIMLLSDSFLAFSIILTNWLKNFASFVIYPYLSEKQYWHWLLLTLLCVCCPSTLLWVFGIVLSLLWCCSAMRFCWLMLCYPALQCIPKLNEKFTAEKAEEQATVTSLLSTKIITVLICTKVKIFNSKQLQD